MKRSLLVTTVLSALVLPLAVAHAQHAHPAHATSAPVTLRLHYAAGHHTVYATRSVQNAPPPVGQTTSTGTVEIDTASVDPNGSAHQRMRLTSMDVQGAAVTPQVRQQIAQGIAGMTMEYTQNARGQVTERHEPSGVSPQFRPLVDGVLQSLDQMSPQMPEQPIAVGGTWTDRKTAHVAAGPGASMDLTMDITYTLRALQQNGQVAVIGLAMTMSIGQGSTAGSIPITGAGNATGEMTIDLSQGTLTESHSNGSMTMHVTVQGRTADVPTTFSNEMRATAAP